MAGPAFVWLLLTLLASMSLLQQRFTLKLSTLPIYNFTYPVEQGASAATPQSHGALLARKLGAPTVITVVPVAPTVEPAWPLAVPDCPFSWRAKKLASIFASSPAQEILT